MKNLAKIFFGVAVLMALIGPSLSFVALGQTTTTPPADLPINTNLPIQGAIPISGPDGQGPAALIGNFYSFAFLLAGFLAFVMIVYGGVRYTFSGGNSSAKQEARESIKHALMGVGLLLIAYLILRTINPDLTNLRMPTLPPYVPPGGTSTTTQPVAGATDPNCPVSPLPPVTGEAIAFENGATVSFTSTNADVQRNLTYLQAQITKAQQFFGVGQPKTGISMTVNSAYRPLAYQQHFYDIYTRRESLKDPATAAACPNLKTQIDAENDKHKLGSVVARPTECAPHVKGIGVDFTFQNMGYTEASNFFSSKGIDLVWKEIPGDGAHYETTKYPYNPSGCGR